MATAMGGGLALFRIRSSELLDLLSDGGLYELLSIVVQFWKFADDSVDLLHHGCWNPYWNPVGTPSLDLGHLEIAM